MTSEGDNLYKFLDPSKFPMEMVTEALQFWYERQEKGKVAFRFKSFLEGKGVREAPPRKKIKVHTVGKGKKPGKRKVQRKGRAENESESDEARPRNKAIENPECNDDDEKDSLDFVVEKPTKKRMAPEDGSDEDGSASSQDEDKPTTEAGSGDIALGQRLKGDDSYWEADLGCSESTDVIQSAIGKKRKYADDEEAPPTKNPRVETSYKLGPRNGRPGKIKKTLTFSTVVQDPFKKEELFKPVLEVSIVDKQSTIGRVVSQAGSSRPPIPLFNFDFTQSGDGNPVKAKPKPRPIIKGKVSIGELGIVTRDRSKKIAQESVRSTRSKKL